eukprot:Rhum_TRINITY_DN14698_c4_g1::Rhum_TRINITY_DN14698_c4_g1_i1::g.110024::m.110024
MFMQKILKATKKTNKKNVKLRGCSLFLPLSIFVRFPTTCVQLCCHSQTFLPQQQQYRNTEVHLLTREKRQASDKTTHKTSALTYEGERRSGEHWVANTAAQEFGSASATPPPRSGSRACLPLFQWSSLPSLLFLEFFWCPFFSFVFFLLYVSFVFILIVGRTEKVDEGYKGKGNEQPTRKKERKQRMNEPLTKTQDSAHHSCAFPLRRLPHPYNTCSPPLFVCSAQDRSFCPHYTRGTTPKKKIKKQKIRKNSAKKKKKEKTPHDLPAFTSTPMRSRARKPLPHSPVISHDFLPHISLPSPERNNQGSIGWKMIAHTHTHTHGMHIRFTNRYAGWRGLRMCALFSSKRRRKDTARNTNTKKSRQIPKKCCAAMRHLLFFCFVFVFVFFK